MGTSSINSSVDIPSECNLDGTELYGPDGQTIADITELTPEETNKLLEGEKSDRNYS